MAGGSPITADPVAGKQSLDTIGSPREHGNLKLPVAVGAR